MHVIHDLQSLKLKKEQSINYYATPPPLNYILILEVKLNTKIFHKYRPQQTN